jgi:signal transduction histidine kinase
MIKKEGSGNHTHNGNGGNGYNHNGNGNGEFSLKRLLFGSVRRQLFLAFSFILALMIILSVFSYILNDRISKKTIEIKDVEGPLELMAEQVIGYDAMLTGQAHASLLHAQKGEFVEVKEHQAEYDRVGILLDDLLKKQAYELLAKSTRSEEDKQKVYGYLEKLDELNIKLVELEVGAFDAMNKNDTQLAYSLIVMGKYHEYKMELADYYKLWADEEKRITLTYRENILKNSQSVFYTNFLLALLMIVSGLIVAYVISNSISKSLKKLYFSTQELERGNFATRVDIHSEDEFEELGKTFNKAAETLGRIDEERKQIDKIKTEFLSITSHELRSPMTPMRAQLQMLLENYFGKLNAKQKESLDVVLRNTERLDKIIVDFLEISRIEAARLKFSFVKGDISPMIKKVVKEIGEGFMPEKKIKIELNLGNIPIIECDPDRVSQALRNLLTHAVKFSKQNGRIIVSVGSKSGMLEFMVRDFGQGISREGQMKIFEPFFQEGGMYGREFGGTGLGLAISKGIVESQNGRIWFNSEKDKGTTFYFTLPFTPVKEMKPIKLLFSAKPEVDDKVKRAFIEFLGPVGEKEFEDLKTGNKINENEIIKYISEIAKKGILVGGGEEFKRRIRFIFGVSSRPELKKEESGKINLGSLKRRGLVK